jgi:hypothetical protein
VDDSDWIDATIIDEDLTDLLLLLIAETTQRCIIDALLNSSNYCFIAGTISQVWYVVAVGVVVALLHCIDKKWTINNIILRMMM